MQSFLKENAPARGYFLALCRDAVHFAPYEIRDGALFIEPDEAGKSGLSGSDFPDEAGKCGLSGSGFSDEAGKRGLTESGFLAEAEAREMTECHFFDEGRECRIIRRGQGGEPLRLLFTRAEEQAMDPDLIFEEEVFIRPEYTRTGKIPETLRIINRYRYSEADTLVLKNYRIACGKAPEGRESYVH